MSALVATEGGDVTFGVTPSRETILRIEQALQLGIDSGQFPDTMTEPAHDFADGLYVRTLVVKAGTCITGKIHKRSHVTFILSGEVEVMTEHAVDRIRAPYMLITPAGTKRAVYAHTDCVWTTVHATLETELDKIEADLIAKSYEEMDRILEERK